MPAPPRRRPGCRGRAQSGIQLPDGRTLAVEDSGDPAGRPVLVHTGTPNSRHLYGPNVQDAAARGLRLISYDRPGYGGSSPQPGRTVADCAGDVRTICAELGIDRLATWGISGGGPHVLACAALLPDLVTAAASLASPAPFGAEGLDYFAAWARKTWMTPACTSATRLRPGQRRTRTGRKPWPRRQTSLPLSCPARGCRV
jgi:pimeloyl-ACP methyl ester carboxylesterase